MTKRNQQTAGHPGSIVSAQAVIHGVLKITWNDGYASVVELRPEFSWGEVYEYLKNPENFGKVAVSEFGHSVYRLKAKATKSIFAPTACAAMPNFRPTCTR